MAVFNTNYNEDGISFWSGFDDPESGASAIAGGSNGTFRPGSSRRVFNDSFFNERTDEEDEPMITLDLLKDANRKGHHCEKYGLKNLFVRRGQEFKVKFNLAVPFDKEKDRLQILFSKGRRPQESKGTLIRIDFYNDKAAAEKGKKGFDWLGYITSFTTDRSSAEIHVSITPNADTLVGSYKVRTNFYKLDVDDKIKRHIKEEEEAIYVLFNAWCEDDQVYMPNADDRDEYVLNETGKIWVGSAFWNHGRSWNFGQFGKKVAEAAFYLLDESSLFELSHGNATLVSRTMSAMVNSSDYDGGVLAGNWSGDYDPYISPSKWNGSVAILEQFMETKKTVRYGQCWVFSGVLTTVCRALGIPTRSVTNFDSAHDHDYSMTIDTHVDENGEALDHLDDSVWNFHVWNEAWFKRPDLPNGYDGWQAFDATPQEESQGKMRCGPAPLNAIKEGNVFLGYDTKFIFSEVNADRVTWVVNSETKERTPLKAKKQTSSVGHKISTKAVGNSLRNDVTDLYKFSEGSTEEREVVTRATTFSSRKAHFGDLYTEDAAEDVVFEWRDEVVGGDIIIHFSMENKSDKPRNVFVRATANAAYYTGATGRKLGDTKGMGYLKPHEKTENTLKLRARYYLNLINEDAKAKVMMFAKVTETKQLFHEQKIFEVEKPDPVLEVSENFPKVGERFTLTIKIKNPVKVALTGGVINLEGPGIQKNKEIRISAPIGEGEEIIEKVFLKAKYPGKREIIVGFNCRQLTNINGSIKVDVKEATAAPDLGSPMAIG